MNRHKIQLTRFTPYKGAFVCFVEYSLNCINLICWQTVIADLYPEQFYWVNQLSDCQQKTLYSATQWFKSALRQTNPEKKEFSSGQTLEQSYDFPCHLQISCSRTNWFELNWFMFEFIVKNGYTLYYKISLYTELSGVLFENLKTICTHFFKTIWRISIIRDRNCSVHLPKSWFVYYNRRAVGESEWLTFTNSTLLAVLTL